ncbi:MAG: hypothetical protein ACREC9_04495 [Methylocella sp.]
MKQTELDGRATPISSAPARKRRFTRIACYALLGAATAFFTVPGIANAELDNKGKFFKLDNQGDPKFNQLLGINDHDIIVGYFGDGMGGPGSVFNNGYVLVPNTHYSVENFAGMPPAGHTITQTQAIGINNKHVPVIVGFWADQNGLQFGWEDI